MKAIWIAGMCLWGSVVMANEYSVFGGAWEGICTVNGEAAPSKTEIAQEDDSSITINGMRFDLYKPTVITLEDNDNDDAYKEITVYDFQWNENKTEINTSAKWLGWYLEKPGSWSMSGTGIIKLEKDELITTRSFSGKEEFCRYKRK